MTPAQVDKIIMIDEPWVDAVDKRLKINSKLKLLTKFLKTIERLTLDLFSHGI